jgi:calcium-dependent protein kinase
MGRYHKLPRKLSAEYQMTSKVLGTGCNGSVRMANSLSMKDKQHTFAVKTFNTKGMRAEKLAHLQAEIEIFMCMDHPHVAQLVDVYESEHSIALVMECMSGGELFNRITRCKHFEENDAAQATRQMLLAVSYVHSHGIVHRDLKLENFLYDTQGSSHLKLIDFGFSKFYDTKQRMRTSCGTLAYVAPEVLRKSYTSQCDLWSMGVLVFILLSGHMPFFGKDEQQMKNIKGGYYVMKQEQWKGISNEARSFVHGLLEVDPGKRFTAGSALEHSWITKHCQEPELDFGPMVSALRSWLLAPKLLRASFSLMAWSLTNKQQAAVRDHFLSMDRNHDGAVSLSELKSIMTDRCGVPEAEVAAVFRVFVESHDREIHYSDCLAATACDQIELDDDLLYTTFQKFDTRGAGYLNAVDFHEVLGVSLEGGQAQALVREADVLQRRDGHIDYAEFVEYIRSSKLRLKDKTASNKLPAFVYSVAETSIAGPTLLQTPHSNADVRSIQKPHGGFKSESKSTSSLAKLEAQYACCSVM